MFKNVTPNELKTHSGFYCIVLCFASICAKLKDDLTEENPYI